MSSEPPKATLVHLTADQEAVYRQMLLNYIFPENYEWLVIALNMLVFAIGVAGKCSSSAQGMLEIFSLVQNVIHLSMQLWTRFKGG